MTAKCYRRPAVESLEPRDVPALIYGLTSGTQLVTFDSDNPGTILSTVAITGLASGDVLKSIDFSPGSNTLFAIALPSSGGFANLYRINPTTGVVTAQLPDFPSFGTLSGSNYSLDSNPDGGRIRVIGDGDENITGTVGLGTSDNAVAGAVGFDIGDGAVERAFITLAADAAAGTRAKLYRIRLGDGALSEEGFIGPSTGSFNIRDIAVALVGNVRFDQTAVTVNESAGTLDVTLRRSIAAQFSTDVTIGVAPGGTAAAGGDFSFASATVTFNPGETTKTVTLNLANDAAFEGPEKIILQLSAGTNNVALSPNKLEVFINDDDPPPVPPPVPPAAPQVAAILIPKGPRGRRKLFVRVLFADTGEVKSEFRSPFQKPIFRNIVATLIDANGDGVGDTVVLTAKKGTKRIKRTIAV